MEENDRKIAEMLQAMELQEQSSVDQATVRPADTNAFSKITVLRYDSAESDQPNLRRSQVANGSRPFD